MKDVCLFVPRILCRRRRYILKFSQMLASNNFHSVVNKFNSLSRSRKIILSILLLFAFLYYFGPKLFHLGRPKFTSESADHYIEERIELFSRYTSNVDAIVNHNPLRDNEKYYPPYVGNGVVAVSFNSEEGVFIRLNRALSLPVKFYPLVKVFVSGTKFKDAFVLDMRSGIAYNIEAAQMSGGVMSVASKVYAHRSHPSILAQEIMISNPTRFPVVVELDQVAASGWDGAESKTFQTSNHLGEVVQCKVTTGLVYPEDSNLAVAVSIGTVMLMDNIVSIKPTSTETLHILTSVQYSEPLPVLEAKKLLPKVQVVVEEDLKSILTADPKILINEHTKIWNKLWRTGFSISHSKALNALNGDRINATLYYVLSNVPAPLHNPKTTEAEKKVIMQTLYYPDNCYGGHSTLFANSLWIDVADEDDIARVVTTWMITLEKQGCAAIVKSGAEGVMQAMLLSLGALKFGKDHLEFSMHPKDLHRDLLFHRINYGNNTHLNISVVVGEDNKANLYASLDRNDKPYYACDAGCIDSPIPLSNNWQKFPVKVTDPLTAILYITADRVHMEELKHAIHVKEIIEAPAHEHHVLALHRHGHHFGGLPTLFWVSIAFLILIFHMFLVKLIYNEYCQAQERFTRSRYSV
ncbi:hypothetical protein ScPMuIL_015895 [Solemya velum]